MTKETEAEAFDLEKWAQQVADKADIEPIKAIHPGFYGRPLSTHLQPYLNMRGSMPPFELHHIYYPKLKVYLNSEQLTLFIKDYCLAVCAKNIDT